MESFISELPASLFVLLVATLGWIGNRVHAKLDEINNTLSSIERDLRKDLAGLDRRVSRLEGHNESHGE